MSAPVSEEERDRRIAAAVATDLAMVGDDTLPLWYLSFCDPEIAATIPDGEERPDGPSWLGVCIVAAADDRAAVAASHRLECNPGGLVSIAGPIPREAVKPEYVGRLLTTPEECEEAGA